MYYSMSGYLLLIFCAILILNNPVIKSEEESSCGLDTFHCESGECINNVYECDGKADCRDGSDENGNCQEFSCPRTTFTCKYGACISRQLVCNGKEDCKDGSDESFCVHHYSSTNTHSN